MRHYFVSGTRQRVMDMITAFLFPYNVHINQIKIEQKIKHGASEYWGHVDFDNIYADIDPKTDGMVHFDREFEKFLMEGQTLKNI